MSKVLTLVKRIHRGIVEIYLLPLKIYRKYFSALKSRPTCRFTPSCSQYACDAVREWGIIIGSALALIRVIRCNPFSKGGYDPVPKRPRSIKQHSENNKPAEN